MTANPPACDKSHMDGPQDSRSGSVLHRSLGTLIYPADRRGIIKVFYCFTLLLIADDVCGRIGSLSFLCDQMLLQLATGLKGGEE